MIVVRLPGRYGVRRHVEFVEIAALIDNSLAASAAS